VIQPRGAEIRARRRCIKINGIVLYTNGSGSGGAGNTDATYRIRSIICRGCGEVADEVVVYFGCGRDRSYVVVELRSAILFLYTFTLVDPVPTEIPTTDPPPVTLRMVLP
jgi:hypothetical protein